MTSTCLALRTRSTSVPRALRIRFGACKFNKRTCTNCAVIDATDGDGHVTCDQDEYIKQLRPIHHHELSGADAEAAASNMVADMFVSLRGALACALITPVR
eukprot:5339238-Pyramimonas_sp.AAC.1